LQRFTVNGCVVICGVTAVYVFLWFLNTSFILLLFFLFNAGIL